MSECVLVGGSQPWGAVRLLPLGLAADNTDVVEISTEIHNNNKQKKKIFWKETITRKSEAYDKHLVRTG